MGRININLSFSLGNQQAAADIRSRAASLGFEMSADLSDMGVMSGSIEETQLDALKAVPGLAGVEPDRTVTIPPIDSGRPQ